MHQLDVSDTDNRVIGNALRTQAAAVGDDVFLMFDDRTLTFAQVDDLANSYAAGLLRLGVGPGDRVCVLMENSPEFALTALAVNKIGAVWVPVNTTYRGEWLRETLADARARLLVVDDGLFDRVRVLGDASSLGPAPPLGPTPPLGRALRLGLREPITDAGIECLPFDVLDTGVTADPGITVAASDTSAVMWTSGTTGRSKGVLQSHSAWAHGAEVFRQVRQIREGDVLYCPLPMFNSGGWVFNIIQALIDGIPVGIDRQFSVQNFWERTRHYGATQITTLGAMHIYLWQAAPRADDRDNPVRSAGFVPIPHELVGPMKVRFGLDAVWQGYGQSEVMPATIAYPGRTWKPNSAGTARPDLDLTLLDTDDEPVEVGEVGEVCVRPRKPGVIFSGYFNAAEQTVEAFSNLWYHTGDLARLDDDGELFFVDRKKDVMRHKGRNIASVDVERAAQAHPGVHEVAAHGVPAAELVYEDEVKLCVVRTPSVDVTAEDLAAHIMDNAPYYLVPRYIEFLDELPHTPTGRVQKFVLRERGVTKNTWDRDAANFIVKGPPARRDLPER
jgi:crotonobetaine/carnitine-CoA ligase